MSTKDKALKLAQEALTMLLDEWTPARKAQLKGMEAANAIKQTLAAPVQEPTAWIEPTPDFYITELSRNTIRFHTDVHGKQEFSKNPSHDCVVPVWLGEPKQPKPKEIK
jgi:hypothetical protein